jgi:invasion protein IalB
MAQLARTVVAVAVLAFTAVPARAGEEHARGPKPAAAKEAQGLQCEHGYRKALCTRCNPKLAPVFKAKGDWCAEHERPESQCALCHPELAKQGIK